jgi:branched-subunit amino acid ABC-type transport system permease component
MLFQQIVSGIATGFIYSLVGLALILVFKATDTINFAVGDMMMFCAFMAYTFLNILKLPYYQVFILTILFSALFGLVLERLVFRPVMKAPVFTVIMLTFGLGLALRGLAGVTWGGAGDSGSEGYFARLCLQRRQEQIFPRPLFRGSHGFNLNQYSEDEDGKSLRRHPGP